MKTTRNTLIINNPSSQMIDFVKMIEKRKEDTRKELRSQKDKFFPKK